jgi:hypothetical protein
MKPASARWEKVPILETNLLAYLDATKLVISVRGFSKWPLLSRSDHQKAGCFPQLVVHPITLRALQEPVPLVCTVYSIYPVDPISVDISIQMKSN